ncbi:Hemolysin, plasmid [Hartmannibacter diazotrophicus]|uniref:Hemolysin, plasmid n=1 Tax=Hartmannibacter diazotrophicus TaxID=1482074 RepID=A0A2C9D5I2_9HYPH|nr:FG-GAP repeat protein [Hartmannibacter diazotrophicus]SON55493.1 Hemolysin, plasmid [Hartmannibacter diazotrophicus]
MVTIIRGDGDDIITTGAEDDTILAGNGNNDVDAGDGDNSIATGNGNDHIVALYGDDMIIDAGGNNFIDAGYGNNSISTGYGIDVIHTYDGDDVIRSLGGNNFIFVGNGNNFVQTGAGADSINTGSGDDQISSGAGNDTVNAGAGMNHVNLADGDDTVTHRLWDDSFSWYAGGPGHDTFRLLLTHNEALDAGVQAEVARLTTAFADGDSGLLTSHLFNFQLNAFEQMDVIAPVIAVDDTATTDEETAISIDVLANDYNPLKPVGDLKITDFKVILGVGFIPNSEVAAAFSISPDGKSLDFSPSGSFDFIGSRFDGPTIKLEYTVRDDLGFEDRSILAVKIDGVNDAPIANPIDLGQVSADHQPIYLHLDDGVIDPDITDILDFENITATDDLGNSVTIQRNSLQLDPRQFYSELSAGESRTVTINYDIVDGTTSVHNTATLVVNGVQQGSESVLLSEIASGNGGFKIIGEEPRDEAGSTVANAGDINGDGYADLLITARGPYYDDAFVTKVYVVFGGDDLSPAGGTIELADIAAGNGGFEIVGGTASDQYGESVASAGDVNGDGFDDMIIGAPRADDGGQNSGAAYVVFGADGLSPAGGSIDLADISAGIGGFKIIGANMNDAAGQSVASAGDINGDGIDDLIIGATGESSGGAGAGGAFVVYGADGLSPAGGIIDLDNVAAGTGGFKIIGENTWDNAGTSVAWAGDVNNDGIDDVIIGATQTAPGGVENSGAAYVVYGQQDLQPASGVVNLDDIAAGIGGFKIDADMDDWEIYNRNIAQSVSAAGDINGDGYGDVIVGAPTANGLLGAAYVVFGGDAFAPAGGQVHLQDVIYGNGGFVILESFGGSDRASLGGSVSPAGDVNGDGMDDLIVGAQLEGGGFYLPSPGAAYVVLGSTNVQTDDGRIYTDDLANGIGGFKIIAEGSGDNLGQSVSAAGDVNGDGYDDLIVGAPFNNEGGTEAGAGYIIYGHADGDALV